MMSDWTQAQCERCWINDNSKLDKDGEPVVRYPNVLRESVVETCCMCGEITIMGIYIRVDPDTVPYATRVVDRSVSGVNSDG